MSVPIKRLQPDHEVTVFFSNSNIHPEAEYLKRLEHARHVARLLEIHLVEDVYDPKDWLKKMHGYESEPEGGVRCAKCIRYRLLKTIEYAKKYGFDHVTTTLTISPHKNFSKITEIGELLTQDSDILFLPHDFKKKNGFKESVEFCRKYEIYRQTYCGCVFSLKDQKNPRRLQVRK